MTTMRAGSQIAANCFGYSGGSSGGRILTDLSADTERDWRELDVVGRLALIKPFKSVRHLEGREVVPVHRHEYLNRAESLAIGS